MAKNEYLVAYDYGRGAVWAMVRAGSLDRTTSEYPELTIVEHRPRWMIDRDLEAIRHYDIDDPPGSLPAALVKERDG